MSQFVESLARLYCSDRISVTKLQKILDSKKIKQQEYDYIISAKKEV